MPVLRLDFIGMYKRNIALHPQEYMKSLGYKPIKAQPESIGDCWFFEVDEVKSIGGGLLEVSNYKFEE